MKWIVWTVMLAVLVVAMWFMNEQRLAREGARDARWAAEEKADQERLAKACEPVEQAASVLKDLGRADLVREEGDFCMQVRGGDSAVLAEVRFEFPRTGRSDLSDAVGKLTGCEAEVAFINKHGAEGYRDHLKLERSDIEAALDDQCEERVREQWADEEASRHEAMEEGR